jgi:putative transposase
MTLEPRSLHMPRPTRLNLAGIPQHITQRGNNRQACFFTDADYNLYLSLLAEASHRHQCSVHAYVLMTNHVHLLMTPETPNGVSLVLRDLGRDYVRQINKTYKRTGTMWEGRFKSSLVDKDVYCLACYRYIELNPVRAGMVKHPSEYQWSSFNNNALGRPSSLLTPHESWLALGETESCCRLAYQELLREAPQQHHISEIRYGVRKGLPTGHDRFKLQIEEALSIKLGDGRRGRPKKVN